MLGLDPRTFKKACHDPIWQAVMDEEFDLLATNGHRGLFDWITIQLTKLNDQGDVLQLLKSKYVGPLLLTFTTQVQQTHETNKTPKDIGLTKQDQLATPVGQAQSHSRYLNV